MENPQNGLYCIECTVTKKELLKKHAWAHITVYKHIHNHYRVPKNDFLHCCSSLFYLHNETVNVWSHVVGAIILLCLFIYTMVKTMNIAERIVWIIYLFSALSVCVASSCFHLFLCHSKHICHKTRCVDWLMVSTLIFSSNLLVSYFELFLYEKIFIVFNVVNFCLMCVTAHKTYYGVVSAKSYLFNVFSYILYGFGIAIVILIKWLVEGMLPSSVCGIGIMYLCYSTVLLNIFHFPECVLPKGSVDLIGYSHNFLHFGVVLAIIVLWNTYT